MSSYVRFILVFGVFVLCARVTLAQQTAVVNGTAGTQITSLHFTEEFGLRPVIGQPYSAVSETESTQTLADGTHIDHPKQTTKMYRDWQGRTRVEHYFASVEGGGSETVASIMIRDPVARTTYSLSPRDHTARLLVPRQIAGFPANSGGATTTAAVQDKSANDAASVSSASVPSERPHPTHTTEDLGSQVIEGLVVEGKKTTLVIPAGAERNDRPITVVTERWLAPELKIDVLVTTSDPRYGDTTTRLTNIDRAEPDPALFQVPADYTITQQ